MAGAWLENLSTECYSLKNDVLRNELMNLQTSENNVDLFFKPGPSGTQWFNKSDNGSTNTNSLNE